MFDAAKKIASHIKYAGAGTLEFIVDGKGSFYFLEMNTRLQVEHPVTEWVTGVDLVAWQLLLASGELALPKIPERHGSAIEVRVYAEDPKTFLPAPGALGEIQAPQGPFVRWDSAFSDAGEVSIHYDPMISKLSVWGADRDAALNRMRVALDEVRVEPRKRADGRIDSSLKTNLPLLRKLTRTPDVINGDTTTDLIPKNPDLLKETAQEISQEAALAVALYQLVTESGVVADTSAPPATLWSWTSRREGMRS
jgi:acetyl/propionyl-CoA carboxylase alpha subunit